MSIQYLLVTYPDQRAVLADGAGVGFTNHTLMLPSDEYIITLDGDGYQPASQDVVLGGTSIMKPMVVAFLPAAAAKGVPAAPPAGAAVVAARSVAAAPATGAATAAATVTPGTPGTPGAPAAGASAASKRSPAAPAASPPAGSRRRKGKNA